MKYPSAFLMLLVLSGNAVAESGDTLDKQFSVGIGTYGSTVAYDNSNLSDDDFSGGALSFAYVFTDQFAVRATFFSLENNDDSNWDSKGYDLLGYFGAGMLRHGFKGYIGGGLFRDKWEYGGYDQTFDGLQLSGGIGYNWDPVSLDLIIGIRDPGDYENFVNNIPGSDASATVVSSSLIISARF
jgi:hypothetical protein